jgi:hypothetical protein
MPTSVVLSNLLDEMPAERVTLGWLIDSLGERSFGIVLLILALLGLLPGVSILAAVLLLATAFQMILARGSPNFTARVSGRMFEARHVAGIIRRILPALRYLEQFIRPRWATPFVATKRLVGLIVLLLSVSMLAPIPLSNLPPAFLAAIIAVAYLEEDGAFLCLAIGMALLLLAIFAAAVWQSVSMTGWLPAMF